MLLHYGEDLPVEIMFLVGKMQCSYWSIHEMTVLALLHSYLGCSGMFLFSFNLMSWTVSVVLFPYKIQILRKEGFRIRNVMPNQLFKMWFNLVMGTSWEDGCSILSSTNWPREGARLHRNADHSSILVALWILKLQNFCPLLRYLFHFCR